MYEKNVIQYIKLSDFILGCSRSKHKTRMKNEENNTECKI